MINDDVRPSGTWKTYLTAKVKFVSLKDRSEKRLMHTNIDNK